MLAAYPRPLDADKRQEDLAHEGAQKDIERR